jgi:hypothetical protein
MRNAMRTVCKRRGFADDDARRKKAGIKPRIGAGAPWSGRVGR